MCVRGGVLPVRVHMALLVRVEAVSETVSETVSGRRRLLACGSGGNRFIELLEAARVIRNRTGQDWDTLCGISAGALLCGMISMLPMDDADAFNAKFDEAVEQFTSDASASPFRPWIPLGTFASALFAVMFRPSLCPGNKEFVRREFDGHKFHASGRRLLVGVFDNSLQKYKTVDSKFHSAVDMRRAITASSAVPIVMPSVRMDGHICKDGGMVHSIPVKEILVYVHGHRREWPVHVDLLISDAIQRPPQPHAKESVTSSMQDVCSSMTWLNLQRDLRELVSRLLVDKRADIEHVLWQLRTGQQRNFERPWGSMRVVSPVDLGPRRRVRKKYRARFAVPSEETAKRLIEEGRRAADAAL